MKIERTVKMEPSHRLSIELCTRQTESIAIVKSGGRTEERKKKTQIKTSKSKSNKYIEIHLSYFDFFSFSFVFWCVSGQTMCPWDPHDVPKQKRPTIQWTQWSVRRTAALCGAVDSACMRLAYICVCVCVSAKRHVRTKSIEWKYRLHCRRRRHSYCCVWNQSNAITINVN